MRSPENNITYNNVDTYSLENIPGFSEYYYNSGYNEEDRENKYMVFSCLTAFFKKNYHNNPQIIETIIESMQKIFLINDKNLKELVLTGFIENLLEEDKEKMTYLRKVLKYPELQKCLDDMYYGWYEMNWKKD